MSRKKVTDYFLYRKRFWIGYGLVLVVLVWLLILAGLYVPAGLTQQEMNSAIASVGVNLADYKNLSLVNLPYQLLQQASINLFGLSEISIKLPSLLLALLSTVGMVFLLRRWFHHNVAVLATLLAITTGQFLFIAQNGTASIMYIFWAVWILLVSTMVVRRRGPTLLWKIVLCLLVAMSLYTPLSIYLLVSLAIATIFHPHLRYVFKRLSKSQLWIAVVALLALVAPLGWRVYQSPEIGLRLLGIPDKMPDIVASLSQLAHQYVASPSISDAGFMLPVFGLGTIGLLVLGIIRLATSHYSAKSYLLFTWVILLVAVLVFKPVYITVTFIPSLIFIAFGLDFLFRYWYRLFPKNPYARIAGLFPLGILVCGMILSGLEIYNYGYHYNPATAKVFTTDLSLVSNTLRQNPSVDSLVVSRSEYDFYKTFAAKAPDGISVKSSVSIDTQSNSFIISRAAKEKLNLNGADIKEIITSTTSQQADRFYIYKNTSK
ncbi:MAG: glycosyltransferase family 39 protein [bacterium]|nr:glycosyltransferase family 39 protein [bacterium]MDN5835052.1 glycosyltransferase family 39 protein [bacterium]